MMNYLDRINTVKIKPIHKTNCVGTAFYIVGIRDKDRYISPQKTDKYLFYKTTPIWKPEIGSLVVIRDSYYGYGIQHIGVITDTLSEIMICHRPDFNEDFAKDVCLEDYLHEENIAGCSREYYRPSQDILRQLIIEMRNL